MPNYGTEQRGDLSRLIRSHNQRTRRSREAHPSRLREGHYRHRDQSGQRLFSFQSGRASSDGAEVFRGFKRRVQADSFEGLLVDYAERKQARVIIRGLRAVSDFEYEFQMAMMNHRLKPKLETFFMMTGESEFYISSRLVKEVVSLGGNVSGLVPGNVLTKLVKKFKQ